MNLGTDHAWNLDADRLHLAYEASFGDKYDKPWGVNFGYRHQFENSTFNAEERRTQRKNQAIFFGWIPLMLNLRSQPLCVELS